MIIARVIGGLGNQMFQYAAGRALAAHHYEELKLDISDFQFSNHHQGFELGKVFAFEPNLASLTDIKTVLGWQARPMFRRFLSRKEASILRKSSFVVERNSHKKSNLKDCSNGIYLSGYWQSEKYFLQIENQIRADFEFRQPMSAVNLSIAKRISRQRSSVSLHIRRGDYVTNPRSLAKACPSEYYEAAVQYVAERVKFPVFFIFSDDIDWVRKNLILNFPVEYVGHNQGAESYNDMRLMSMCSNHIIANSTFSWWGAWLNPRPDKVVIAPRRWFTNDWSSKDLIPEGWVTL